MKWEARQVWASNAEYLHAQVRDLMTEFGRVDYVRMVRGGMIGSSGSRTWSCRSSSCSWREKLT